MQIFLKVKHNTKYSLIYAYYLFIICFILYANQHAINTCTHDTHTHTHTHTLSLSHAHMQAHNYINYQKIIN